MGEVDRLVWAATTAVRVGSYHLGIRSSSNEVDRWVRETFAEHLVDDPEVPANYSLRIIPQPGEGIEELHVLYRGCAKVISARSPRRVVQTLLAHLAELDDRQRESDLVRLDAGAVIAEGRAAIIPASLRYKVPALHRRLEPHGLELVDALSVAVDPHSGALVLPPCRLVADGTHAVAPWSDADDLEDDRVGAVAGRYHVVAWAFMLDPPPSRAAALAAVVAKVNDRHRYEGAAWVRGLARSMQHVVGIDAGPQVGRQLAEIMHSQGR